MKERQNDEIKDGAFNDHNLQETKTTHSSKLFGKREKGANKYPVILDSPFSVNGSKVMEDSPRLAYHPFAGKSYAWLNSNGGGFAILEPTMSMVPNTFSKETEHGYGFEIQSSPRDNKNNQGMKGRLRSTQSELKSKLSGLSIGCSRAEFRGDDSEIIARIGTLEDRDKS
ncbi:hypothetical protein Ancab_031712 [Ancistrocladus abbreviatus]